MTTAGRRLTWLAVYAAAMAFVESAVVVYLRLNFYPEGFAFPIRMIPEWVGAIEVGREAATLVMLLSVAWLASPDRWGRFLNFCFMFGVWDVFYYIWLWVMLRWPPSLLTRDILFLIPVPWIGPVLAPLLVSLCLIAGSIGLIRLEAGGARLGFPAWHWGLVVSGGLLVLLSFLWDWRVVLSGRMPPPFRWWLFGLGLGIGVAATAIGFRTLISSDKEHLA